MTINRRQSEARLLARAAQDPEFKRSLLADPRAAIEQEFGVKLPAGVNIRVLEEKGDDYYVVLPLNPEGRGNGELNDAELEAVAGGNCYMDCGCDVNCDY